MCCARGCSKIWNPSSGICGTEMCSRPGMNYRAWKWIWMGRRLRPRTKRRGNLLKGVEELLTYVKRNQAFIPNYGQRYRNGERIASGFVESAVNQVISKRMVKQQQMAWSQR